MKRSDFSVHSPQNIFFDLDGTLTDPRVGIVNCLRTAVEDQGLEPPSDEQLARFIGPPLRTSFPELLGTTDTERIERAVAAYRVRFKDSGMFENEVYPGVVQLLKELRLAQKRMWVVTAKPEQFAKVIVEHFGLSTFFDGVYGPGLDGNFDDKAELLAHVLSEHALAPQMSVMVGDRANDVIAGKKNGVRTVGVLYGYGSVEELSGAGADLVCASPEELTTVLGSL